MEIIKIWQAPAPEAMPLIITGSIMIIISIIGLILDHYVIDTGVITAMAVIIVLASIFMIITGVCSFSCTYYNIKTANTTEAFIQIDSRYRVISYEDNIYTVLGRE